MFRVPKPKFQKYRTYRRASVSRVRFRIHFSGWGGQQRSSFAILTSGCRVTFPVAAIYPENRSDSHDICESERERWMTCTHVI
jgi:hypothetical protein